MLEDYTLKFASYRFHGVMVSTLAFEFSDPSSNLGGTLKFSLTAPLNTWFQGYLVLKTSQAEYVSQD